MVLELTHTLLPDLEAIERVMIEKQNEKLNAKGKASTARSKAKSYPKRKASGSSTGRVPKKGCSEKFWQCCKAHGGLYPTHNILDCHRYDSNGGPLKAAAGEPSQPKKPYKKFGGIKGMAFMQTTMFEAYAKSQKKAGKSKRRMRHDNDSSDSSDSE
jgi:hypothetical protein